MAAPEYVPIKPMDDVRVYESPPRRPAPWLADRPGDFRGAQPRGPGFGNPGPDQGYALKLADEIFRPMIDPADVNLDDAVAGCVAIGMRRSSLFGRAPVAHDLRLAFRLWGFFEVPCPEDLKPIRRRLFDEVSNPHHYLELRMLVETVPESTLRRPHTDVRAADWHELLEIRHA